jgi:hypothetical protein
MTDDEPACQSIRYSIIESVTNRILRSDQFVSLVAFLFSFCDFFIINRNLLMRTQKEQRYFCDRFFVDHVDVRIEGKTPSSPLILHRITTVALLSLTLFLSNSVW